MSERYKLDGNDEIKPTPFDAHEQVTRRHHKFVPIAPGDISVAGHAASGYKPAEYEFQEFPKAEAPADPEPPEAA